MINIYKAIQRLLIVVILILSGTIVYSFTITPSYQAKEVLSADRGAPQEFSFDFNMQEGKPFDGYGEVFRSRDIFKLPYRGIAATGPQAHPVQSRQSAGAAVNNVTLKKFKLVGVLIDKSPRAVVEDAQKKETFFLKRGDVFNGMTVEDILQGKIVMDNNGERFEIKTEE